MQSQAIRAQKERKSRKLSNKETMKKTQKQALRAKALECLTEIDKLEIEAEKAKEMDNLRLALASNCESPRELAKALGSEILRRLGVVPFKNKGNLIFKKDGKWMISKAEQGKRLNQRKTILQAP